jgi:hypothetical protein
MAAAVALTLAASATGYARHDPRRTATPAAAASATAPDTVPLDDTAAGGPADPENLPPDGEPTPVFPPPDALVDEFDTSVVLPAPPPGGVQPVTLTGGEPGFLLDRGDGELLAVSAVAQVPRAPAVIAWCPLFGDFEDPSGDDRFSPRGWSYDEMSYATTYAVRPHPGHPGQVEVAGTGIEHGGPDVLTDERPQRCPPDRLLRAPLPPFTSSLRSTGWHRVHGSLRVVYQSARLCPARARCGQVDGAALGPADRAGVVEYAGDFLVHGAGGSVLAARLPGLTERESRVGAAVRVGFVRRVVKDGGATALRFDACRWYTGSPADDSPGGRVRDVESFKGKVTDPRDGTRDYPLRSGAEIWVANYADGPSSQTDPDGLADELGRKSGRGLLVWVVLDARGRVMRVIEEAELL